MTTHSISKILKEHPSLIYADDMQALCKPLQKLNITYFSHARIDENGNLAMNASDPDYLAMYYQDALYNFGAHARSNID